MQVVNHSVLQSLEELIGTERFIPCSEQVIEQLRKAGAGIEVIPPLLAMMERHPLDDFGMPGAFVHFIESFEPDYEPLLVESIRRRPALYTIWMLKRCMKHSPCRKAYRALLSDVFDNHTVEFELRRLAGMFSSRC